MIMALNFPASPSDGDTFNGYVWIESQNAWRKDSARSYTASDTPPVNPKPGQVWFHSTLGAFFTYYSDGDSSQWIEIAGSSGRQGIQGIQGEQGIQGIQGEQGIQGIQGEQGIQGIQGIQGEKGDVGPSGTGGGGAETVFLLGL